MTNKTLLTKADCDNAYLVKVTVADLSEYSNGAELNEIIGDEFDDMVAQALADVKVHNERRFIMIEVIP